MPFQSWDMFRQILSYVSRQRRQSFCLIASAAISSLKRPRRPCCDVAILVQSRIWSQDIRHAWHLCARFAMQAARLSAHWPESPIKLVSSARQDRKYNYACNIVVCSALDTKSVSRAFFVQREQHVEYCFINAEILCNIITAAFQNIVLSKYNC